MPEPRALPQPEIQAIRDGRSRTLKPGLFRAEDFDRLAVSHEVLRGERDAAVRAREVVDADNEYLRRLNRSDVQALAEGMEEIGALVVRVEQLQKALQEVYDWIYPEQTRSTGTDDGHSARTIYGHGPLPVKLGDLVRGTLGDSHA